MTVLVVLVLALVGLRLVLLVLRVARVRQMRPVSAIRFPVDPCLGPVTGMPPRPLPGSESALQARLVRGAISGERYRAEMARLAADDQLRHPVRLPPA